MINIEDNLKINLTNFYIKYNIPEHVIDSAVSHAINSSKKEHLTLIESGKMYLIVILYRK